MKKIWQVPKYLPYIQPDLADDVLRKAEESLGHHLPSSYVDLLKTQNGGYIRYTLKDYPHSIIQGIGPYFPSITDVDWNDYEGTVSFKLDGLIPFDGDGHWFICFDYRDNKNEPIISFIDTESDTQQMIAKNFDDYLNLLEIDTENHYVIQVEFGTDSLVNQISKIANIEFEAPDSWAKGYPTYRGKFDGDSLWISSNKVPTGFIREDDDRFEELKHEMDDFSLRFPELGENTYLLFGWEKRKIQKFVLLLNANDILTTPLSQFI